MRPFNISSKDIILVTLTLVLGFGGGFYLSQNPGLKFKILGAQSDRTGIYIDPELQIKFDSDLIWSFYRSSGVKLHLDTNLQSTRTCFFITTGKKISSLKNIKTISNSVEKEFSERLSSEIKRYLVKESIIIGWNFLKEEEHYSIETYHLAFSRSCPDLFIGYFLNWWSGPKNYSDWLLKNPQLKSSRIDLIVPAEQSAERIKDIELNKISF